MPTFRGMQIEVQGKPFVFCYLKKLFRNAYYEKIQGTNMLRCIILLLMQHAIVHSTEHKNIGYILAIQIIQCHGFKIYRLENSDV